MTFKAEILSRFSGEEGERLLYLPDLTLWYDWHQSRGTLPDQWKQYSLPQVARALGVPVWGTARPWRVESSGVRLFTTQQKGERIVRSETHAGTLVARWTLGPDGAWWQTEYPVKTKEDLAAGLELVNSRSYILDSSELGRREAMVGDDGILATEIPRRPYSDLLHELLGWSEGLMLLNEPAIQQIIAILETKLQRLVQEIAGLPGHVIFAPDNLDGQFISPTVFGTYLAGSYRRTVEILHQHDQHLLVHVGGPVRHLLAPLAEAGVDGVEGVAGPPQGDMSLAQAREIAGRRLVLWGGIPQDFLLDMHDRQEFEATVVKAVQEARGDSRTILGVADRVPVDADLSRLEAIPVLVEQGLSE